MRQPYVAEEPIVSFLVEDQLAIAAEAGIHLPMAVQVRRIVPGAMVVVEIQHRAFADVDE